MSKEWTLRELAAETGVPGRTIRFYISRGLVDPPLRAGRGAAYGEAHKARLEEIRRLQAQGLMLAEIAQALAQERVPGRRAGRIVIREIPKMDMLHEDLALADLESHAPGPALPEPELWRAYPVAADVVVLLKGQPAPWRKRKVFAALRAFAAIVENGTKKEDGNE